MSRAEFYICVRCGRKVNIAGFDEWEVPELCSTCEENDMKIMLPEELNKHIRKVKKDREQKEGGEHD